jgi:hypothetical protein
MQSNSNDELRRIGDALGNIPELNKERVERHMQFLNPNFDDGFNFLSFFKKKTLDEKVRGKLKDIEKEINLNINKNYFIANGTFTAIDIVAIILSFVGINPLLKSILLPLALVVNFVGGIIAKHFFNKNINYFGKFINTNSEPSEIAGFNELDDKLKQLLLYDYDIRQFANVANIDNVHGIKEFERAANIAEIPNSLNDAQQLTQNDDISEVEIDTSEVGIDPSKNSQDIISN